MLSWRDGVSRLYILQEVEDASLSLRDTYAADMDVELPAYRKETRQIQTLVLTKGEEILPQMGTFWVLIMIEIAVVV